MKTMSYGRMFGFIAVIIAVGMLFPTPFAASVAHAQSAPSTGSSDAGPSNSSAPSTGSSNAGPSSPSAPDTGSSNAGPSSPSAPNTGSSNAGPGSNGSGGNGNDGNPTGPAGVGTIRNIGNGPIFGGGFFATVTPPPAYPENPNVPGIAGLSCPFLTTTLSMGSQNDQTQMIRLQSFLKAYEKANVDVNGVFDQKTFTAVEKFQTKYTKEILTPWGASKPSGYVGITTKKKINEMVCSKIVILTAEEQTKIAAFKAALQAGMSGASGVTPASEEVGTTIPSDNPVENTASVINSTGGSNAGSETVATATTATTTGSKFMRFIRNLFNIGEENSGAEKSEK